VCSRRGVAISPEVKYGWSRTLLPHTSQWSAKGRPYFTSKHSGAIITATSIKTLFAAVDTGRFYGHINNNIFHLSVHSSRTSSDLRALYFPLSELTSFSLSLSLSLYTNISKDVRNIAVYVEYNTGRKWPETVGNGVRLYWQPRSTTEPNI
jgi:hypothetical protein